MVRTVKAWCLAALTAGFLAACGGGGDPGDNPFDGGTGTDATYTVSTAIQRDGVSITSMTASETVQAVARLVDANGDPVGGAVVTFAESGADLLTIAPVAATALTDSDGYATVDLAATSSDSTGATTIVATATVSDASFADSVAVQITAGGSDGGETLPSAINFVGANPSGVAIVIKGAGGNGRSESATLTFKVVDANNSPIEGVHVDFTVNPADTVTLNIASAVSDSSGIVSTTVQSGSVPTSVVVTATATEVPTVTGQSDTLVVSNGVPVAGGFEIVAEKYNLDGRLTGDTTKVSAYVVDESGNPVPDGVAVSFTTDLGGIGSSELGGCLTENGTCSVDFRVQEPRGEGLATIVGQVRVNESDVLSDSIQINMSGFAGFMIADEDGAPVTSLTMTSCQQTFDLFLQDIATGRSPTAKTVIARRTSTSNLDVSVVAGSPVPDYPGFDPAPFSVEVDATSSDLVPLCVSGGTVRDGGTLSLSFTTPGGNQNFQTLSVSYPQ